MSLFTRPRGARLLHLIPLLLIATASCGSGDESSVTLTSVTPSEGSARGGETVKIKGSGFGRSPEVRFGDEVAEVVSATASSIEVRTPRRVAGPVTVEVAVGSDHAELAEGFIFEPIALTFVDVAWSDMAPFAASGGSCVAADVDGDGHLDILQAARAEGVYLLLNDGKGKLGQAKLFGTGDPATDVERVEVADLDGDGELDLLLTATGKTRPRILRGDGKGTFKLETAALPERFGQSQVAAVADLDGDDDLDLVLTGTSEAADQPGVIAILLNEGGVFSDETKARLPGDPFDAPGVAAADVDGDGDLDLLFTGDQAPARLYLNDGLGTFGRAAPDALPGDSSPGAGIPAIGDLDGDGAPDIYLPTATQDRVWINVGEGHFADLTEAWLGPEGAPGVSAQLADLDFDGHLDVLVIERPGALRLYRNDGKGHLFDYSGSIAGNVSTFAATGVAVGDLDGDGDADLYLGRAELARPALFTNWGPLARDDEDGDGFPDGADSCPAAPNPAQENRDSHHFGCESASICKAETGCDLVASGPSAYLVCRDAPLPWPAAADFCVARGARLVVIETAGENTFLASVGVADAWIGYSDTAVEGTFAWVSGSSVYAPWAMNEPNDSGGVEDCAVVLADGSWNDADCGGAHAFFCEDTRAKVPDPGDACDACPGRHDPGSKPVTGDAGTCDGTGGSAP